MKRLFIVALLIGFLQATFASSLPTLIPYRAGDYKWGFCNSKKEIVIPIQFDDARPFYNGRAAVLGKVDERHGWFFINNNGNRISDLYEEVEDFQEDCSIVRAKKNGFWCLLDINCKGLISPTYLYIREFHRGCAWAVDSSSRKWILISETGKALSSLYDYINDFDYKRTIVGVYNNGNTDYKILKHNGQMFKSLKNKFEFVACYSDGLAVVRRNNSMYSYLGKNGKLTIDLKFKNALGFSNGIAIVVNEDGKTQAINKRGKILFDIPYFTCYDAKYMDKRLPVFKDNKLSVIDDECNLISSFLYDAIIVSDGVIAVKSGEKWGFADINGHLFTKIIFDENRQSNNWVSYDVGYTFDGGLCRVFIDGKVAGYIDTRGNTYWDEP